MITCWTRAGQRHTAAGGPSTPSRTLRSSTALRGGEWLPSGRTVRRLAVCAVVASETPRSSGARAAGSAGSGRGGLFGGGLLGKLLSSSRRGRPHRATVGLGPSDARFAARRACCCLCLLALLTASAFVAGPVVSDIAARALRQMFPNEGIFVEARGRKTANRGRLARLEASLALPKHESVKRLRAWPNPPQPNLLFSPL